MPVKFAELVSGGLGKAINKWFNFDIIKVFRIVMRQNEAKILLTIVSILFYLDYLLYDFFYHFMKVT